MTTLREAAQQALEALESSRVFVTTREKTKHPEGTEWYDERIATLRAALAEPQEPVAKVELMATGGNAGLATRIVEIDNHLRERLRPGQLLYTTPPQRPAEPQQEPAFHGFMSADGTQVDVCFTPSAPRADGAYATAYYTASPQRKPLTDEEIYGLYRRSGLEAYHQRDAAVQYEYDKRVHKFARNVEAAHGIKEKT